MFMIYLVRDTLPKKKKKRLSHKHFYPPPASLIALSAQNISDVT